MPAPVLVAAAVLALLALSAYVRTRAFGADYWMDEALSIGIASHSLGELPGALRADGSPPLYYALLNGWIGAFGDSEHDTHALSLAISLLSVPAALWAGWSLFGRRAGLIAAALAAVNPFLTFYAQETRMYALVVLLSLLAAATFAHAVVLGRRAYLPAFAIALAALLYTHNWAVFLALGAAAAALLAPGGGERRPERIRAAAIGFAGAAVLYLPWLPTLVFQAQHTGAPWAPHSTLRAVKQVPAVLLDGVLPALILAIAAGAGTVLALRSRGRDADRERLPLVALIVLLAASVVAAWAFARVTPGWAERYFALFLGPLLILLGGALARAGAAGVAAAAAAAVLWAAPESHRDDYKGNTVSVAERVAPSLRPADLVISTQPEQVALLRRALGPRLRYASPLGRAEDPREMDWRDAVERLEAARVPGPLAGELARVPRGARVVLARPVAADEEAWSTEWLALVRRRSDEWERALDRDPRFRPVARVGAEGSAGAGTDIRATVYVRAAR